MANILPRNLRDGLVLHLNEQGTDVSGNGNNGTLVNSPTVVRRLQQKGLSYNGSNQYISHPTFLDTGLTDWTVCYWIKTTTTTQGFIVDKTASNTQYPFENYIDTDGKIKLILQRNAVFGANFYNNSKVVNDGKWHFISIYGKGSSATSVYIGVDMVFEQNRTTSGTPIDSGSIGANTSYDFNIGRRGSASNYFNGQIINPMIWNRVLSPTEIQQLYIAQFIR